MKIKKLDTGGFEHVTVLLAFVVIFAIAGVGFLVASHADSNKFDIKPTKQTNIYKPLSQKQIYQNYGKALMDSGRLTDQDGRYIAQIKAIAKGDFSCNVNPTLLRMLVGVVVRDKHRVQISSLNRKCTGVLTASGPSSYHYRDGGGHAIDVVKYDGDPVVGSNDNTKDYLKEAAKYLPKNTGYGQSECGSHFDVPNGSYKFSDTCDHQHIQVPVRHL